MTLHHLSSALDESGLFQILAAICTACGLLVFVIPVGGKWAPSKSIVLGLDFWTAAGLLRLTGTSSWSAIATAALLVCVRKILTLNLKTLWARLK